MHFRCDNVWKRLAEAAREKQESGESTCEGTNRMRPIPNVFMAVPTIYSKMIEAAEHNVLEPGIVDDAVDTLSDMRLMISGSAALPVSINEKWRNLTGHILLEVRLGYTFRTSPSYRKINIYCYLIFLHPEIWNDRCVERN